jgi:hypothetical protein
MSGKLTQQELRIMKSILPDNVSADVKRWLGVCSPAGIRGHQGAGALDNRLLSSLYKSKIASVPPKTNGQIEQPEPVEQTLEDTARFIADVLGGNANDEETIAKIARLYEEQRSR